MRIFTTKKAIAVAAVTAMLLGGAGVAYAYWTNSGTGTGTATSGTNNPVTVNQTTTVAAMYPGQAAQTLAGDFTNGNNGSTFVTAVTATTYSIDATHVSAGCTVAAGNYTLGGSATVNADVPAGTHQGAWTGLTITMNNLPTNQDACKGATVTINYTSS